MTVYTQRVASVNGSAGDYVDSTPVPAGQVWVLRDLLVVHSAPATATINIWVVSGLGSTVLFNAPLEMGASFHLSLRQTLYAGEVLRFHCSAGDFSALATAYVFPQVGP